MEVRYQTCEGTFSFSGDSSRNYVSVLTLEFHMKSMCSVALAGCAVLSDYELNIQGSSCRLSAEQLVLWSLIDVHVFLLFLLASVYSCGKGPRKIDIYKAKHSVIWISYNYPRKWITFVGDRKFEISGGGSKEPTPKLQPQLVNSEAQQDVGI
jgi:hypothetical protein